MERIEHELRELMAERASEATLLPPLPHTVRRVRRRRAAKATLAASLAVAVAGVTMVGTRLFTEERSPALPARNPETAESAYEFESTPGTRPVVATGEFRGAQWELTATPGGGEIEAYDLELSISKGDTSTSDDLEVMAGDTAILAQGLLEDPVLGDARAIYGAVMPSVDSLEVDVADDLRATMDPNRLTIVPHRFESTRDTEPDYFVAFVPADSPGFVHARDALEIDVGVSTYGGASLAPSVVAGGTSDGSRWTLEIAAEPGPDAGQDELCLDFTAHTPKDPDTGRPFTGTTSTCLDRSQVEGAGPLFVQTFTEGDVLGVVAIMSDDVGVVRLANDDGTEADLPWFQPPRDDLGEWPIRLVAVGLEPGTTGSLQALGPDGEVIDEERFGGDGP